jgi:hypothetical protein
MQGACAEAARYLNVRVLVAVRVPRVPHFWAAALHEQVPVAEHVGLGGLQETTPE